MSTLGMTRRKPLLDREVKPLGRGLEGRILSLCPELLGLGLLWEVHSSPRSEISSNGIPVQSRGKLPVLNEKLSFFNGFLMISMGTISRLSYLKCNYLFRFGRLSLSLG